MTLGSSRFFPPRFAGIAPALALFLAMGSASARSQFDACPEVNANPASNLTVTTPGLQYTVTNFDPSWFDTDHPENAPTLFYLTMSPDLAGKPFSGSLRLHLQILADTSRGHHNGNPIVAFDRVSGPLDPAKIGVTLRSNDVFEFAWQAGGITFTKSPLYDLILETHVAPEMDLIFRFSLTCENVPVAAQQTATVRVDSLGGNIGRLRYVKMIQALYPGTRITNPTPVPLYTITPIFKVASELFNAAEFDYPADQPRIEIFLYEMRAGTNPKDALDGLEFAKFGIFKDSPTPYPPGLPQLEPGMTYVWRARAILRGPTSDYLYSDPLYFKVDERLEGSSSVPASELNDFKTLEDQVKYGDDYTKRVMAALKIILGDNFEIFDLSRAGKVPAKGQIRLNGHPYSLEELERLAREFHQSRHSVTRLRFQ
ncbi:MAG TPA: hypothetical protein VJ385_02375 [Fibrobacteria bacterium]|nr:hypothetical protein [Fibrobacteria bacterium]